MLYGFAHKHMKNTYHRLMVGRVTSLKKMMDWIDTFTFSKLDFFIEEEVEKEEKEEDLKSF